MTHEPDRPTARRPTSARLGTALESAFFPNPDTGQPRLFPRQACVYSAIACAYVALEIADGGGPEHPGVLLAIPPAVFLSLLYVGLYRWTGPGLALLWWVMPSASVIVVILAARATDGHFSASLAAASLAFAFTAGVAEWLRRHPRVPKTPTNSLR